jgi:hypothetical protein
LPPHKGWLLQDNTPPTDNLRANFVRRAIETNAPLLAAPLARFAEAQRLTWAELAESLGVSETSLDRLACCKPPRPDRFEEDVEALAEASEIDVAVLTDLLPTVSL